MRSSTVLASLLFGSFAAAAPFNKRDLIYKTEVVVETVVVYTTVWDDDEPAAATTTSAGFFYEHPQSPSSAPAVPTDKTPASPSPAPEKPASSSVAPPPPPPSSPKPTPTPTPSPAPKPVEQPKPVEEPKPSSSPAPAPVSSPAPAPVVAAPVASSPAPAPAAPESSGPSTSSSGSGEYSGDITIYDNNGGNGACGTPITDSDMVVALAKSAWGQSTYDRMTGAATNPWCGQKIKIFYGGNSIDATIMDMCPGCSGHDIDLSLAAWKKLTGLDEKTRLKATWSPI